MWVIARKLLTVLLCTLLTLKSFGADTTYYENGNILSITKYNKYRIEFYPNGIIKQKTKFDRFCRKGKEVQFDSLGNLTSKGKFIFRRVKHGKWKHFKNGKKIKIVKYKYGIEKSELYTETGKKIKCLLIYGLGSWGQGPCETAIHKFKVQYVAVAGCIVTNKILFRTRIHNFFVETGLILHHGFKWRDKIENVCLNSRP